MPMAFSKRTYRMECTQPFGVKAAVDSVTTTGKCTSAHSGIDTCSRPVETAQSSSNRAKYVVALTLAWIALLDIHVVTLVAAGSITARCLQHW